MQKRSGTTRAPGAWTSRGDNTMCDMGAGEKYLGQSSGQQSTLDRCKQSCQNEAACTSITYFPSGWCSHFSTDCSKTKTSSGAVAMQKRSGTTRAPGAWTSRDDNTMCDMGAGEKYLGQSSGQQS